MMNCGCFKIAIAVMERYFLVSGLINMFLMQYKDEDEDINSQWYGGQVSGLSPFAVHTFFCRELTATNFTSVFSSVLINLETPTQ